MNLHLYFLRLRDTEKKSPAPHTNNVYIYHEEGITPCIQTKTSFFLFFASYSRLVFENDIDKVKACRSVWGSLLHTYPQSFVVHYHEAIGGTVCITRLEKIEMIDEEIHQKCSPEDS